MTARTRTFLTPEQYREAKARAMTERQLLDAVLGTPRNPGLALAYGWRGYHTHRSEHSPAGFPDLVLVHAAAGRVVFAELKTERGKVTPAQAGWLDDVNAVADAITTDQHAGRPEVEAELLPCRLIAVTWRPSDLLAGTVERMLRVETHAPGLALPPLAR